MTEEVSTNIPAAYFPILEATEKSGFPMASDIKTCSLLATLAASKPSAKFLELGTGTGLSTSWILNGMCSNSSLISIDNNAEFLGIAEKFIGTDDRLKLECVDGEEWVTKNKHLKFDYIFADTWHGKYLLLDEVLEMLNFGAFYIIDDMLLQTNWPEGHDQKAKKLVAYLSERKDLQITKQSWATGIIIAVKK